MIRFLTQKDFTGGGRAVGKISARRSLQQTRPCVMSVIPGTLGVRTEIREHSQELFRNKNKQARYLGNHFMIVHIMQEEFQDICALLALETGWMAIPLNVIENQEKQALAGITFGNTEVEVLMGFSDDDAFNWLYGYGAQEKAIVFNLQMTS